MSLRLSSRAIALILVAALTTVLPSFAAPAQGFAATSLTGEGSRTTAIVRDAITSTVPLSGTANLNIVTSTSGLSTIALPRQIISGGRLVVLIHTIPRALVTFTVQLPDGTIVVRHARAALNGYTEMVLHVTYQPQGGTEYATVIVESKLRAVNLDDTIQANVAIRQHIVLTGILRVPASVVAGHILIVSFINDLPGVQVAFRLTYPDNQVEPLCCYYTNASGILTEGFSVSSSDGTGPLLVEAVLNFSGTQRILKKWVTLRAPRS